MGASVSVDQVSELPSGVDQLVSASVRESFRSLERLRAEWESGANRFSNPGEALFVAHVVLPEFRRQGVARCPVTRALAVGHEHHASVRLRTDNPVAAKFYEALGFALALSSRDATHEIALQS